MYIIYKVLLAMEANIEEQSNKDSFTPLMEAASTGSVEFVKLLIAQGSMINASSFTGQ